MVRKCVSLVLGIYDINNGAIEMANCWMELSSCWVSYGGIERNPSLFV
jgi:hypothetical protein